MNKLTKTLALITLTIVTLSVIPVGLALITLPVRAQQYTITASSSYLHNYSWIEIVINAPGIDKDNITVEIIDKSTGTPIPIFNSTGTRLSDGKALAKKYVSGVYVMYLGGNGTTVKPAPAYNKTDSLYTIDESSYPFSPGAGKVITIRVPELGFISTDVTYDYAPISISFDKTAYGPWSFVRLSINDPNWNLDPTDKDELKVSNVLLNITITNSSGTTTLNNVDSLDDISNAIVTRKNPGNETAVNSGVFRFDIDLTKLAEFVGVSKFEKGTVIKFKVIFKNYTDIYDEESFSITSVAPTIELSGSFSDEVTVRVTYPDANKKSWDIDRFNISLRVYPKGYNYSLFNYIDLTVEETDDDTGVFEGKLILNWTAVKSKIYDGTNWITIERSLTDLGFTNSNDLIMNASNGKSIVVRANMTYEYEGKEVAQELVITPVAPTVTLDKATYYPTDTVKVTIVDPDLNDNKDVVEVYVNGTSITNTTEFKDIPFNLSGTQTTYLYISFLKLPEGSGVKPSEDFSVSLVERYDTPGTFDLKLNLSKFNIAADSWYRIKVYDLTSGKNVTVDFQVVSVAVKVELDRSVYPLVVDPTKNLVVYIRVTDPTANKNPYAKDTITLQSQHDIDLKNYTMGSILGGWTSCTLGSVTLTETDVNSGVFEGSLKLGSNCIGNTTMINGIINVSYVSPYGGGSAWVTATFRPTTASVSVNATVVKYGDYILIRVVDPDANLDSKAKESITLTPDNFSGTLGSVSVGTLELDETDVNSGVFEGVFLVAGVNGDINVKAGDTIELTIADPTPGYITPGASWEELDLSTTFKVASFTGKLSTDKTEYGPGGVIVVRVEDPDANKDVKAKDSVTVSYSVEGLVGTYPVTLTETDVNSGVFEGKLKVGDIVNNYNVQLKDLVGKRIVLVYRDEADATGKKTVVSTIIKIVSVDPVISFDKSYYNVGDIATITVDDMDANVNPDQYDTISIRVYSDSDPVGVTIPATETGNNTGVFTAVVLVSDTPGGGRVYAKPGDKVYVEYKDSYPADYAVTGKEKTFTASVPVGLPVTKPISAKKADFVDPRTGVSVIPKVGSMVGISVELSNVGIADQVFTAILVVKDPAGVVVKVDSISIPLAAGKSGTVTFSYIPKLAGDYTVEVYIVKSLADWTPLGDMLTKVMSVVS